MYWIGLGLGWVGLDWIWIGVGLDWIGVAVKSGGGNIFCEAEGEWRLEWPAQMVDVRHQLEPASVAVKKRNWKCENGGFFSNFSFVSKMFGWKYEKSV